MKVFLSANLTRLIPDFLLFFTKLLTGQYYRICLTFLPLAQKTLRTLKFFQYKIIKLYKNAMKNIDFYLKSFCYVKFFNSRLVYSIFSL